MKILFVGQRGIPVFAPPEAELRRGKARSEQRVQALAQMLVENDHEVAVTCTPPFGSRNISHFNGVELIHLFSLDPNKAGGWVYTLLELATIWWRKSDVVHVHGWRMAALAQVAVLLRPKATYVWTVDAIPSCPRWLARVVAGRAAKVFDAVTAPTRALQYRLARDFKLPVGYVPDGYAKTELPNIPLRHFGLRQGQQYVLALATTPAAGRQVAKAYSQTAIRKKLVVLRSQEGAWARLAKQYSFWHCAGEQTGRARATLLAQAAVVVVADQEAAPDTVLQAMECGRAIVAVTPSPAEEVLGGAALLVKANDSAEMARVLKLVVSSSQRQAAWGKKAQRRARAHFAWKRILPEYEALYHYPWVRPVALDSAIPALAQSSLRLGQVDKAAVR